MVVRFLSLEENRIATTLLDLVELSDGTAETLHDAALKTLDKHGLSIKNCLGLCTDGANAMCGKHNSLFSRLSEDNKDLILIKCSCHSLDLVASKSMEAIPSAVEHLVRETYNYFAHSSCWQDAYKRLYASMTVEDESANPPPKILSLSQTRWLAIADSIERILAQYQSLEEFFEKAEDRSYNVRILREMLDCAKSAKERRLLADRFALDVALEAMQASSLQDPTESPLQLKSLKRLTEVQTFYVSYCSHFCGEPRGQVMCNLATNGSEFSSTFR
nr:SCAN domain-containing protein 3-like [Dermacentor andersoni]